MSRSFPGPIARIGAQPLPVALLTGFLGSGKTSFLRRVLADPAASDTDVLINEFGEIGLDHLIVEATRPGDVVQLPNGCMCCAVKQD
jgi:G3E family GTPase